MLSSVMPAMRRALMPKGCQARLASSVAAEALSNKDPLQVESMNKEQCIIVDEADQVIGMESKTDCHLMENINKGLIHRAFSVLMFNDKKEFLLTQRAAEKITFPGYYTNACCSHPSPVPEEMEDRDFVGIKRAAVRRLHFELGIDPSNIPLSDIHFMTRFTYVAQSDDPLWGEREMDYVLVINKHLDIHPNKNELKSWKYVSQGELNELFAKYERNEVKVTQWFYKLSKLFLPKYWDNLDNLDSVKDQDTIHHQKIPIGKTNLKI
ncbi:Isopentenyl-diphosphate Delta-isomerase 1 [Halotydeus destructor]|nr:Isopentenyl-diphosphate Delta-isomerase 1 [Halotydeus destructor]